MHSIIQAVPTGGSQQTQFSTKSGSSTATDSGVGLPEVACLCKPCKSTCPRQIPRWQRPTGGLGKMASRMWSRAGRECGADSLQSPTHSDSSLEGRGGQTKCTEMRGESDVAHMCKRVEPRRQSSEDRVEHCLGRSTCEWESMGPRHPTAGERGSEGLYRHLGPSLEHYHQMIAQMRRNLRMLLERPQGLCQGLT